MDGKTDKHRYELSKPQQAVTPNLCGRKSILSQFIGKYNVIWLCKLCFQDANNP